VAAARRAESRLGTRTLPGPWPEALIVLALVLWAQLATRHGDDGLTARAAVCIGLCAAARTDLRTGYLFDAVTLPTALLAALLTLGTGRLQAASQGVVLLTGLFGAVAVASRGACLGFGDVKAMYAIGAAFGPVEGAIAVAAASVSGLAFAVLSGKRREHEIAFGPHLALGTGLALAVGPAFSRFLTGFAA
jgi:prepilin signal peptidase PulO-like enzyme (type II secretory pathway)